MKREHFSQTATVAPDDNGTPPTLRIEYEGPTDVLDERLTDVEGTRYEAGDVDVAFRLQDESVGVVSIADSVTGTFVCEVDADGETIKRLVRAAEEGEGQYRVAIVGENLEWRVLKRTLLVYDDDGQLLRTCSLIPGSVEL